MTGDKLAVLYEDNHLLVVNKPAGTLVQGDATGDEPLVEIAKRYIKAKYNKPGEVFLGVVHRLDRPVTGVVLFARTSKALARMNEQFKNRTTLKIYWAVVKNKPPHQSGSLVHWLQKDEKKNKTTAHPVQHPQGKRSELNYEIQLGSDGYYLLRVIPVTGRSHQIRAQLATMGCPIVGDIKYGYREPNQDGSICLHAKRLELEHPVTKKWLFLEANPPQVNAWTLFI